jgi:hypothetical protein
MPGARNAVETCLGVQPGEHVALIADEASRAVAASMPQPWTTVKPLIRDCFWKSLGRAR